MAHSSTSGIGWFTREEILTRGVRETFLPADLADLVAAALADCPLTMLSHSGVSARACTTAST
ncbi:hypothetical protein [Catellatospora sp. NPDC049609]|uniref:hypothetical protein n=1 Tax=Catellatospora sp. NPDC049609 TaxID=3155505 RepID=UPI003443D02B